jgi:hypothetical protein
MKISEEYSEPLVRVVEKGNSFSAGKLEADSHSTTGFYVRSIGSDGKVFRNRFNKGPLNRMRDCRKA